MNIWVIYLGDIQTDCATHNECISEVHDTIFLAFDSDSSPFSSPNAGYRVAVFQVCKICAFNQSNAIVLIAKCQMFF